MRSLTIAMALMAATPTFAETVNEMVDRLTAGYELCGKLANTAGTIMRARQDGMPKDTAIGIVNEGSDSLKPLFLGLIDAYYSVEIRPDAESRSAIVLLAVAAAAEACREGMSGKGNGEYAASIESWTDPAPSAPANTPSANDLWIVVASRSNQQEAINLANSYSHQFPSVQVFLAKNGWFAVSVGYAPTDRAQAIIGDLLQNGKIPSDSYLLPQQNYHTAVWAATDTQILN